MSGPRGHAGLLLVLLLLLSWFARTGRCQDEDPEAGEETAATPAPDAEADGPDSADEVTNTSENDLATTLSTTATDTGENPDGSGRSFDPSAASDSPESTADGSYETPPTSSPGEGEEDGLDLLVVIPVAVVVLLIVVIVSGVLIYRRNTSQNRHSEVRKEDPFLEGSSTEKVPMPMFEEDVPSVLELEMDQLDDWMKKDDEPTHLNQQA